MDILQNSVFSLLLMGLVTTIALVDWVGRRGRGAMPFRWQPVARALAGARIFIGLGLMFVDLSTPSNYYGGVVPGFLLSGAGLVAILLRGGQRISRFLRPLKKPEGRPAKFLLFLAPTVVLFIIWSPFYLLAPHILDALGRALWNVLPHRIVADLGLLGWIGDGGGVTCLGMHPRDVAVEGLNLVAGVTLLFWLFQDLWDRAANSVCSSLSTPT